MAKARRKKRFPRLPNLDPFRLDNEPERKPTYREKAEARLQRERERSAWRESLRGVPRKLPTRIPSFWVRNRRYAGYWPDIIRQAMPGV